MHTMTAYIAIDRGERPVWLTLCTSRDGAMRAATECLMSARDYERLGTLSTRWRALYRTGVRIRKALVEVPRG